MYTGALCGTWISPRNPYVAHGARSWESLVFTTLVPDCAPHSGFEAHGRLHLTDTSPPVTRLGEPAISHPGPLT
eukprot:1185254-Prorocentrum_minimum.AAC.1